MKKQQTNKQNAQPTQELTDEQLGQVGGGQSISPNPTMGPWSVVPLPNGQPWNGAPLSNGGLRSDYGHLGGAPFHATNIEINYLNG